jgi:DNA-binding response OmpR family regulator
MLRKKIFIVEDDKTAQQLLRLIFENAGYEIEVSDDGQIVYSDKSFAPDLVLLDKNLGGYDGIDICRHLKTTQETANIPVIMLSGTPGAERQARDAGADHFMEKPFNSNILKQKVSEFLTKNHA